MIRPSLFRSAVTGVAIATALTTSARAGHGPDPVGPYDAHGFSLRQGAAAGSLTPAAAWYFKDEWVAVPAGGTVSTEGPPGAHPPDGAFAWFPGPDRLAGLRLDADVTLRREDGTALPYALAPKLASNRSYYDASSARYLQRRTLSMRGAFNRPAEAVPGAGTFVARTIWPKDWRLPASLPEADAAARTLRTRIDQALGAAPHRFRVATVWMRPGVARAPGTTQFAVAQALNGAQGDDDEAHGGHFALATGRLDGDGRLDHWLVNNFHGLDSVSEKGILAATVPMDGYMTDLTGASPPAARPTVISPRSRSDSTRAPVSRRWVKISSGSRGVLVRRALRSRHAMRPQCRTSSSSTFPRFHRAARGTAPAGSFDDYMRRVPADRAQWKVVPVPPRPFPDALRSCPPGGAISVRYDAGPRGHDGPAAADDRGVAAAPAAKRMGKQAVEPLRVGLRGPR